jgi:hypothetical protein
LINYSTQYGNSLETKQKHISVGRLRTQWMDQVRKGSRQETERSDATETMGGQTRNFYPSLDR